MNTSEPGTGAPRDREHARNAATGLIVLAVICAAIATFSVITRHGQGAILYLAAIGLTVQAVRRLRG